MGPPTLLANGQKGYFPGTKQPVPEVKSHLFSVDVEKKWSYATPPFTRLHCVDKKHFYISTKIYFVTHRERQSFQL